MGMYRIERYLTQEPTAFEDDLLEVSQSRLELSATTGEKPGGEIKVRVRSGREVHVFLYSNHYRMQCPIHEMIGQEGVLSYRFDTTGLEPGAVEKGELCILSELGEHRIPFVVTVRRSLFETSLGEIRNLFHFANLAREYWEEAVRLFYSEDFSELFYGHDQKYYDLYRGLSANPGNEHNVDEFLTAIHKKQKNTYHICEEDLLLQDVVDGQQETVSLVCDGWGYQYVEIQTRGEFLSSCQPYLTGHDFENGRCSVAFEIHTAWLKPGTNIGRIEFIYEGGREELAVIVETPPETSWKKEEMREMRRLSAQLLRDYIAYSSMQGESRQEALAEAEKTVEKINGAHGRNLLARICQMHIFLLQGRTGDAGWVLSHIERTKRPEEIDPSLYGYYLYVRSLLEQSESFNRSVREEITSLYEANPGEMLLACLYARVQGTQMSVRDRLSVYEEQYLIGARSPILYIETLMLFEESPAYLSKLDAFEISVLTFAMRYGMYSRVLAQRVTEIAARKKNMSDSLFRFLTRSYNIYPGEEQLNVLCTLMIRAGLNGKEYFPWYERAVNQQLRITSLYEYYMLSADTGADMLLPRTVLMYFAYQCQLDERRKAYLFSLLIRHREEIPELLRQYEKTIEEFALASMDKGVISENLAIVYRYVLGKEDLEIPQEKIQRIAFRHLVKVKKDDMVNVVVLQNGLRMETVYPIEKNRAYVDCYTSDYEIFLEDAYGNRYCDASGWYDLKLMATEKSAVYLEDQESDDVGFLIYRTHIAGMPDSTKEQLWPLYEKLIGSNVMDASYNRDIAGRLLRFYFDREQYDKMQGLLDTYDMEGATASERADIIHYFIYMEQDERALDYLYRYGFEYVPPRPLTRLIGRQLADGYEYDHRCLELVYHTFCLGKYTKEMLEYLCRYFEGSMKQMYEVWQACVDFDVDASKPAERILQAYLFSHGYLAGMEQVFAYYVAHQRRESVVKSYIYDMSYRYFVKQQLSQPDMFRILEEMLADEYEMAMESIVAYLYYMATEVENYTQKQKTLIADLVNYVVSERQYIPFFSAFIDFIPWLRPYAELTYLVYRSAPGSSVTLHYVKEDQDGEYTRIRLEEVCAGYYCHRFLLFFGERLQYYFMEQRAGQQILTESGYLEKSDMTGEEGESRYGLLNDIIMSGALGDDRTKRELIHTYELKSLLTEALFGDS